MDLLSWRLLYDKCYFVTLLLPFMFFICSCLINIWPWFYSFNCLELILTFIDIFPNFQVNSCSWQKILATTEKHTHTQNHPPPSIQSFLFFLSLLFKFFFDMFKESQKSLHWGLQVTGQLKQKWDHFTVQSMERQSYQETSSRFYFISWNSKTANHTPLLSTVGLKK